MRVKQGNKHLAALKCIYWSRQDLSVKPAIKLALLITFHFLFWQNRMFLKQTRRDAFFFSFIIKLRMLKSGQQTLAQRWGELRLHMLFWFLQVFFFYLKEIISSLFLFPFLFLFCFFLFLFVNLVRVLTLTLLVIIGS